MLSKHAKSKADYFLMVQYPMFNDVSHLMKCAVMKNKFLSSKLNSFYRPDFIALTIKKYFCLFIFVKKLA